MIKPEDSSSEPAIDAAQTDAAQLDAAGKTHEVLVVHAPRYARFIILGGIVGLIVTLLLTVSFPEQPGFSTAQVFGFLGLALVTVGVALGAAAAIVIDRMATRRARTGVMEVVERVQAPIADDAAEVPEASEPPGTPKTLEAPEPETREAAETGESR